MMRKMTVILLCLFMALFSSSCAKVKQMDKRGTLMSNSLRVDFQSDKVQIFRQGQDQPILVQNAVKNERPYIHPILSPDGNGVLTEDRPPHHAWQHGLYIGLNKVSGIGFWEEGLRGNPDDGSFAPAPISEPTLKGNVAHWGVETDYLHPDKSVMLHETQDWTFTDQGDTYALDLKWTLNAKVDLTFGKYPYGGLFIRMPFRKGSGGRALNSEGKKDQDCEAQRARWLAIAIAIDGRNTPAGVAMMDHPKNAEHPVPWRMDSQFGIAPSRCIAGEWKLAKGESVTFLHRVLVFPGDIDAKAIEKSYEQYTQK